MSVPPKVLVTGAAGFIGSHLSEKLLKKGYQVIGIDNLNPYYAPALKKLNLSLLKDNPGFRFCKLDILAKTRVFELINKERPLFLVHTAARAGVRESVRNPLVYTETNVLGSHILLEAIRRHSPTTRSVLFSTSSVYGVQAKVPFTEEMVPDPQSPYALTKYQMELLASYYGHYLNLPLAVIRPFSIYGPRGRPDMAPFLMIRAAEKGEVFTKFGTNQDNQRDWTYINDFVNGVIKMLENHDFATFQVFNLGNGKPVGIDDFVDLEKDLIKKYLGKKLKIKAKPRGQEELPITYAEISKAQKLFGYNPGHELKSGLEELFKDYVEKRPLYLSNF